ncbi:MAG: hypothetical protein O7E54_12460 [Planctomycetota bacterium]|nr:hypothetical protein [Planctomycetota bacterium]
MSRYRKTSPVPFIAGGVMLAVFIGVVVWSGDRKTAATPPVGAAKPALAPVPEEEPPLDLVLEPPPEPVLTVAQAEKRLRGATKEWRAFALQLCKEQNWKSEHAVAFLRAVTWNDRDPEKQHAHGLASIWTMLGAGTKDPVALVTALEKKGSLTTFFEQNWSMVAVDWKPQSKVTALEDAWKPNRIRWGFPLDTPVKDLQNFQNVDLRVTKDMWRSVVGTYIDGLNIDEDKKITRAQAAIGEGRQAQEKKLRAGFRVIFDMPNGTVKEVVEKLLALAEKQGREKFVKAMAERLDDAVKAAEKAE